MEVAVSAPAGLRGVSLVGSAW